MKTQESSIIDAFVTEIIEENEVLRILRLEKEKNMAKNKQEVSIYDEDEKAEISYAKTSCNNCQYAVIKEDGNCRCTKNIIKSDIELIIAANKTHIKCAAHSDYNRLETRYTQTNKYYFSSDDVCKKCHREITEKSTGKKTCRLCEI